MKPAFSENEVYNSIIKIQGLSQTMLITYALFYLQTVGKNFKNHFSVIETWSPVCEKV